MDKRKIKKIEAGKQYDGQLYLPFEFNTARGYLNFHGFASKQELLDYGFKSPEIKSLSKYPDVCCSCDHLEKKDPLLYWMDDPQTLNSLSALGRKKAGLVGKIYSSVVGKTCLCEEDQDILESFKGLSDPIRIVIGN